MSMNDMINEQLSALADNELSADEARFLLKRIANEPALRQQWDRLHLIRACLRRELTPLKGNEFAAGVMAAIAAPAPRAALPFWLKPLAGGAIAAAVAAVALLVATPKPAAPELAHVNPPPSLTSETGLRTRDLTPPLIAQPVSGSETYLETGTPSSMLLQDYLSRQAGTGFAPYVLVVRPVQSSVSPPLAPVDNAGRAATQQPLPTP
jgi:negative regulator of sigma E activity